MRRLTTLKRKPVIKALNYENYDKIRSISKVIYGVSVLKVNKKGKKYLRRFYLSENNKKYLQ